MASEFNEVVFIDKKTYKKNCLLLRFDYLTYVQNKKCPFCNLLKRHLLINILKYIVFVRRKYKENLIQNKYLFHQNTHYWDDDVFQYFDTTFIDNYQLLIYLLKVSICVEKNDNCTEVKWRRKISDKIKNIISIVQHFLPAFSLFVFDTLNGFNIMLL